jgi:dihydrolipoamide dehydrogenase
MRTADECGIVAAEISVDLARMRSWKDGVVTRMKNGIVELLKRNGVSVVKGTARFTGPDAIEVALEGGGTETIQARQFMIATGSRPFDLPGFAVDGRHVITSTEALDLERVPKSLLVLGGGVIGLEIGTYLAKFGTELTVVELTDQLLPGTDPDLVAVVARSLKKKKAAILTGSKALGATVKDGIVEVRVESRGVEQVHKAEIVLVSVGRKPNTEKLGLDAAQVKTNARGWIEVDRQLRTSNPKIFAIGDVVGGALLAHKASKEGLVAAAVMAGGNDVLDVRAMPSAIFTDPEIATTGLSEAEARKAGHEVRVATFPFGALGRAVAGRETEGLIKMVADAKDDRLLGVGIVGANASDLIAEATLAIEAGLCAEDVGLTVHAHPTLAESMHEVAEALHGHAIHVYQPKK